MNSCLYLVATPIGNLEDITLRALRILKEVDIIAAEDTRQTVKLLNHYDIKKPMISYHEHNKKSKGEEIIKLLMEGKTVALVSDAGMPSISDLAESSAFMCRKSSSSYTGPSASLTALSISGLSLPDLSLKVLPVGKEEKIF